MMAIRIYELAGQALRRAGGMEPRHTAQLPETAPAGRPRPIADLIAEFASGERKPVGEANPDGLPWAS
jgi:hypothetical protein